MTHQQALLSEYWQSLHQSSFKTPQLVEGLGHVGVDHVPIQDGGDPVESLPGTQPTAGPDSTVRSDKVHTALVVLSKEMVVSWDLKQRMSGGGSVS